MLKFSPAQFLPRGAIKVSDKHSDARAFIYTSTKGKPAAQVYYGKQSKPVEHSYYSNETRREQRIMELFEARQSRLVQTSYRRTELKEFIHAYKVGDIFYTSWGYDQTNCEFFEVTNVRGKHLILREIAQAAYDDASNAGKCSPLPGQYIGDPIRRIANSSHIKIDHVRRAWILSFSDIAGIRVYPSVRFSSGH